MLSRPVPVVLLLLALSACGTPQERCINGVTRELRTIDNLIGQTELNLTRGYSIEEYTITREFWVPCGPPVVIIQPDGSRYWQPSPQMCIDDADEVIRHREAIDPVSEQNKLDNLRKRQRALTNAAEPAIAQCRLLHPE